MGDIEVVRPPARDHARAKLLAPQPARPVVNISLRVDAVKRIRHQWRRAQPAVVIEVLGHRHLGGVTSCRIARKPYDNPLNGTDTAVANKLARSLELGPRMHRALLAT